MEEWNIFTLRCVDSYGNFDKRTKNFHIWPGKIKIVEQQDKIYKTTRVWIYIYFFCRLAIWARSRVWIMLLPGRCVSNGPFFTRAPNYKKKKINSLKTKRERIKIYNKGNVFPLILFRLARSMGAHSSIAEDIFTFLWYFFIFCRNRRRGIDIKKEQKYIKYKMFNAQFHKWLQALPL